MKKFIIERNIPGAGQLSQEQLQEIARTSCKAAGDLDASYHWVQTFVTDDKMYCVHIAPDEATIRQHAKNGGFPADSVKEVATIFDASTAG